MERAADGVLRELREELGLTLPLSSAKLLALTDDLEPAADTHHLHLTFKVEIGAREPKLMEPESCERWAWFSLSSLPQPMFPPHAKILRTIDSGHIYL
jgi:ADP-ribose pyrophosphatase YjhB (NUDIX family)